MDVMNSHALTYAVDLDPGIRVPVTDVDLVRSEVAAGPRRDAARGASQDAKGCRI